MCVCSLQQTMVTQMSCPVMNSRAMTAEEYFNPNPSHTHRDIGQPCHLTTKTQRCLHISHHSHMFFMIIIFPCLWSRKDRYPKNLDNSVNTHDIRSVKKQKRAFVTLSFKHSGDISNKSELFVLTNAKEKVANAGSYSVLSLIQAVQKFVFIKKKPY